MADLKIESVVVCDDVRQEKSGKFLLIGVYGADIIVNRFPTNVNLAVWILAHLSSVGQHDFDFRIVGQGEVTLAEGHLVVDANRAGASILVLPGIPIQLQGEGELRMQLSKSDDNWQTIKSILVKSRRSVQASTVGENS